MRHLIESSWVHLQQTLGSFGVFLAAYTTMAALYGLGGLLFYFVDKSRKLDKYKIQQGVLLPPPLSSFSPRRFLLSVFSSPFSPLLFLLSFFSSPFSPLLSLLSFLLTTPPYRLFTLWINPESYSTWNAFSLPSLPPLHLLDRSFDM
jgi:hypothetical protein